MHTQDSVETGQEIVVDLGYITPESQIPTDDLHQELQRRGAAINEALQAAGTTDTITVTELAAQIGVSEHIARKLLDRGEIPGAMRKTPGVKNSPWIIWAGAGAAYLQKHRGKAS